MDWELENGDLLNRLFCVFGGNRAENYTINNQVKRRQTGPAVKFAAASEQPNQFYHITPALSVPVYILAQTKT